MFSRHVDKLKEEKISHLQEKLQARRKGTIIQSHIVRYHVHCMGLFPCVCSYRAREVAV